MGVDNVDFLKIIIGLIVLFLIIFIKQIFLPRNVFSFFITVFSALIIGLWIK